MCSGCLPLALWLDPDRLPPVGSFHCHSHLGVGMVWLFSSLWSRVPGPVLVIPPKLLLFCVVKDFLLWGG